MIVLLYVKRILHRLGHMYLQSDKVEGPDLSKPVMVSISSSMKDNIEMRMATREQMDTGGKKEIHKIYLNFN